MRVRTAKHVTDCGLVLRVMQRIISSAIALGLLIVGLCFLYLELFAEPTADSNNLMLGAFSVGIGAAGYLSISSLHFCASITTNHDE